MTLPSSGSISMSQVNVELGCSSNSQRRFGETSVRTLFGVPSGQISMSNGWGKSNFPGALGTYQSSQGGYYTGTQSGYHLWVTTTSVSCYWKTTNTATTNASSLTDGYTNTMCNANATHPAFQYADNLSAGGFSDWYVGARCELQQQFDNRCCGTIPAYGTGLHWSSTEGTNIQGCALSFYNNTWSLDLKTCDDRTRPIRRSLI